ncbi:MAG TPA: galactitol-1-phosphate 5-dehydrogenase [Spirochaetia bacterium]|nr:galactitol-1-phosphate 5-dehydrogenase [Spirochaetia bacterium]
MKALVLTEYKKFEFSDVPDPVPAEDEVLIQVKACGICGSDVHGMDGSSGRRIPPIIMGHEASGVITSIGKEVSSYKVGDRVTFDSTIYCGECWYCRRGDINLCDNRRVLGVSCDEYRRHGAFAEYVTVPERILYRIPEGISFEHAALTEPVSIAVHAVARTPIALGDTAVVAGTGMIGLLVVQVLKAAGCGRVIAVDIEEEKLALAKKLGADVGLNPKRVDVPAEVRKLTDGRGADVSFEVVGIGATLNTALATLRKGGIATLVGNLSATAEFPHQSTVTREISINGSCASQGEYPACIDMIARKKIDVAPLVSKVVPLSEGAGWFKRLYDREPGLFKVVLVP